MGERHSAFRGRIEALALALVQADPRFRTGPSWEDYQKMAAAGLVALEDYAAASRGSERLAIKRMIGVS